MLKMTKRSQNVIENKGKWQKGEAKRRPSEAN
jgi:hypothetical protein